MLRRFWRKNRSAELENVFLCPCVKNQCAPYVQKKKINPIGAGHSFSHLDDLPSGVMSATGEDMAMSACGGHESAEGKFQSCQPDWKDLPESVST